jgi:hypothetical protein
MNITVALCVSDGGVSGPRLLPLHAAGWRPLRGEEDGRCWEEEPARATRQTRHARWSSGEETLVGTFPDEKPGAEREKSAAYDEGVQREQQRRYHHSIPDDETSSDNDTQSDYSFSDEGGSARPHAWWDVFGAFGTRSGPDKERARADKESARADRRRSRQDERELKEARRRAREERFGQPY